MLFPRLTNFRIIALVKDHCNNFFRILKVFWEKSKKERARQRKAFNIKWRDFD